MAKCQEDKRKVNLAFLTKKATTTSDFIFNQTPPKKKYNDQQFVRKKFRLVFIHLHTIIVKIFKRGS